MPIEGGLRELGLTDLLQLVHLSRKTGTLTVRAPRASAAARLDFDRGAVVGAAAAGEAPRLGQLLITAGRATQGQVERALAQQRAVPGRRLGALLVEREGVAREEVERQLRFQVEQVVFDLLRWEEGHFRFEESPALDPGPVAIRISTEGLLLDALRRMDEWSALSSAPPDTDLVPGLVESEPAGGAVLTLQPAEWEVLAAVDGERTLRAIAGLLGRAELDVARAVFSLVGAGVVELRHREPVAATIRTAPRSAEAEAEVEAALRAGRRGEWGRAVEALETAIRRDPLLGAAYYALGMAALRTGDAARAVEALETYLRLPESATRHRARARRAAALAARLRELFEEEDG